MDKFHFTLVVSKLIISTLIKKRVADDGVPTILYYRPSDLYLTDRKQTMTILQKIPAPLSTFADKAFPRSSLSPTTSLLSNYKTKSLEQSSMVAAAACRRRPFPCLRPVRPPVTTTLHSSSPYLSSFIFFR